MFILLVLFCFPSAYFSFSDSSYTFHSISLLSSGHLLDPVFPSFLLELSTIRLSSANTYTRMKVTSELCATNPVAISKSSFCFTALT